MTKNVIILAVFFSMSFGCTGKPKRPDEAEMHYQLAQTLFVKGETAQGFTEIMTAVDLDDTNPDYQNLLGLALIDHGKFEEAEKHLKKAVELDPKYSEAHNHLCALYIQTEKYDRAIAHCQLAVGNILYATPERAYQNLGVAYQKKGDLIHAEEAFKKALMHNPNFVMSQKSLGLMMMEQKKFSEASKYFDAAGKTCLTSPKGVWGGECPEVFYNLGLCYVKLRVSQRAQNAFRSCVNTDLQGAYGAKCRDKLKIME